MNLKQKILAALPPYEGKKELLIHSQETEDIINGILEQHNLCKNDYDKIYKFFLSEDIDSIAAKIFSFLKQNVPYKIETESYQKLKTPAAILQGSGDCKSYALFIGGIIAAINRNENENIPMVYRFAGYNNNEDLEHVFIVLFAGTDNELWIDPVLNFCNEKKLPYFWVDKKIKPMALYRVSGIGQPVQNSQVGGIELFGEDGLFSEAFEFLDNSSRKWKSRTNKMKEYSPSDILAYYINQLSSTQDLYWIAEFKRVWGDGAIWGSGYWDYLKQKASKAAGASQDLVSEWNKIVSNLLSKNPDFLKGRQNLAYYNNVIPSVSIFSNNDNTPNGGGGGGGGGTSFLAKAAGAAALYFLFK